MLSRPFSRSVPRCASATRRRPWRPLAALLAAAGLCLAALPGLAELAGHGGFVKGVAVSPDGTRAISASFDYRLILWRINDQSEILELDAHEAGVNAVAFRPDGRQAVSAGDDGTVRLWALDSGRLLHTFAGHGGKVPQVAVSPDGRTAASAGWDRSLRLWDLERLTPGPAIEGLKSNPNAVAFLPDGERLVSGEADGTIRIWRVSDGAPLASLPGHDFGVTSLSAGPGGLLISAGIDETLRLWDLASGEERLAFLGHEGPVFGVALSPDGRLAASGGADRVVRVWEVASGELRQELLGHLEPVWSLAFTPDARYLLSAGSDEVVRVWDLAVGLEVGGGADRVARAELPPPETESQKRGAKLFAKCSVCHAMTDNGGRRAGPSLVGIFGRRAGSLAGYNYSEALRSSDLVWTEETIDRLFAEGPHLYTPGSKMPLQQMPDPEDRLDLIAYLKLVATPRDGRAPGAPADP